jgi:hypothetical protein
MGGKRETPDKKPVRGYMAGSGTANPYILGRYKYTRKKKENPTTCGLSCDFVDNFT